MSISLTPELEKFIQTKVDSGFYYSASEVVRESLRLLAEHDSLKQKRTATLNYEIQKGIDQIKAGNIIPGDQAYQELISKCE